MSQSKLHPEYLRQKALQDAYLVRKNKKTDFYNGIYDRWENPVLTRESIPLKGEKRMKLEHFGMAEPGDCQSASILPQKFVDKI